MIEEKSRQDNSKPQQIFSSNGCRVFLFENSNFKTNSICFNIISKLTSDTATKNALLTKVLRRGCSNFKSSKEISVELESCFGATLTPKIEKIGDNQIIGFNCSYPADEFVGERVTSRLVKLLFSVIFEPLVEPLVQPLLDPLLDPHIQDRGFNCDYLEQERKNLKDQIEGQKDDKKSYAISKCAEVMFAGEAYSICEFGELGELMKISNSELFTHYQEVMKNSQIVVFLSGRFDRQTVDDFTSELKKKLDRNIDTNVIEKSSIKECLSKQDLSKQDLSKQDLSKENTENSGLNEFVEELDVEQGKLTIGFTTETSPNTNEYIKMMVANSILGGGTHSKLFAEVREKKSLAYYTMTIMDKYKGVIFAASGIDPQNKVKTMELIFEQLAKLQRGEITEFEIDAAKKVLINSLRSLNDSQLSIQTFYFGQLLAGSVETIDSIIEIIAEVTVEDVVDISKRIKPHTVYFLTSKTKSEVK